MTTNNNEAGWKSNHEPPLRNFWLGCHLQGAKARLDDIKRFDMAGFQPRYEYLREMKRYGVLPASFDLANLAKVDPYELDQKYWRLFWHIPDRTLGSKPNSLTTNHP